MPVDTDIVTGLPKGYEDHQKKAEAAKKEQIELEEKVAMHKITTTPDGERLLEFVKGKAIKRIDFLAHNDPEMGVYIGILKDLKMKEKLAEDAFKKLYELKK